MASSILIYRVDKNGVKRMMSANALENSDYEIDIKHTLNNTKITNISTSNPDSEGVVTITIALEYGK